MNVSVAVWICSAQTAGSRGLALVLVALASFVIVAVFCRMSYHHFEVMVGRAQWNEPLDMPNSGRRLVRDSPRAAEARDGNIEGNCGSILPKGMAVPPLTVIDTIPASSGGNTGV